MSNREKKQSFLGGAAILAALVTLLSTILYARYLKGFLGQLPLLLGVLTGGLTATCIATDGIAVIVNKENSVDGLTSDQVKGIYTGEITDWSGVAE